MAGVYLSYFWLLSISSIGLFEVFFFSYFLHYSFNTIKVFKNNTFIFGNDLGTSALVKFIVIWHILSCFILKNYSYFLLNNFNFFNIIFLFFILYFFSVLSNTFLKNSQYLLVALVLFISTYFYTSCDNFITMLLVLETVTTLYYFFFLKYSSKHNTTLIKYKNLISQYLWLSFFTLVFFILNLIYWVYLYGTLNFQELETLVISNNVSIFILIGFFWKLGLPLFHFFKLELYQFLDLTSLVLFSVTSLLINTILFIFLLYTLNVTFTLIFLPVTLSIMCSIPFLIQSIDKLSLYLFFAVSSVNTWVFFILISLA